MISRIVGAFKAAELRYKSAEQTESLDPISSIFFARQTDVRKFMVGGKSEVKTRSEEFSMFVQQVTVVNETNILTAIENDHKTELDDWEHTRGQPRVDA